jgi:hypothetical protein
MLCVCFVLQPRIIHNVTAQIAMSTPLTPQTLRVQNSTETLALYKDGVLRCATCWDVNPLLLRLLCVPPGLTFKKFCIPPIQRASYGSQNKQRLFPYTTVCFL